MTQGTMLKIMAQGALSAAIHQMFQIAVSCIVGQFKSVYTGTQNKKKEDIKMYWYSLPKFYITCDGFSFV